MPSKWVYSFGGGTADGDKGMKAILGGKGANLHELSRIGVRVPPGFTLTAEACCTFAESHTLPDAAWAEIEAALRRMESLQQQQFAPSRSNGTGAAAASSPPLFLSVRSGAALSMPGMMDTVLSVGMNDDIAQVAREAFRSMLPPAAADRLVADSYRRFVMMYCDVVAEIPRPQIEACLAAAKAAAGVKQDVELDVACLLRVVADVKALYTRVTGKPFPEDPREQLRQSVLAVLRSWNNPRAVSYRELNRITGLLGTAVTVQAMVFGNASDTSGTGVLFTRNPSTGEDKLFGEFLPLAELERTWSVACAHLCLFPRSQTACLTSTRSWMIL